MINDGIKTNNGWVLYGFNSERDFCKETIAHFYRDHIVIRHIDDKTQEYVRDNIQKMLMGLGIPVRRVAYKNPDCGGNENDNNNLPTE